MRAVVAASLLICTIVSSIALTTTVQAGACAESAVSARGEESRFVWMAKTKARANWRRKVRSMPGIGPSYANWARAENTEERCHDGTVGNGLHFHRHTLPSVSSAPRAIIILGAAQGKSDQPRPMRARHSPTAGRGERGEGRDAGKARSRGLPRFLRSFARTPLRPRLSPSVAVDRIANGRPGHRPGRCRETGARHSQLSGWMPRSALGCTGSPTPRRLIFSAPTKGPWRLIRRRL